MAPMSVNKPHLRAFRFPAGALGTFTLVLGLYYLSHGTPGTFSVADVSLPLDGLPRTLTAVLFYSVLLTHVYEAYLAYSLASDHRASATNKLLYTICTFIFGFPLLIEMKRQIQLTRVDSITGKRNK